MPFGTAAIITCAIGFLFTLPICFFGKEKYAVTEDDPNAPEKEPFNFKQMWTYLKANKFLLLKFYKLKSKDAAVMAKYNAGEITREECDAQLSRKY